MPGYSPHLVGNMRYGSELGLEPWLLPQDAFSELRNGHLYRGVLEKRKGHSSFGRIVHSVASESIGASGSINYAGTLSNIPLRAGDLSFTDGTLTITDDGDGTLSGDVGAASTINYTTGAYDITFSSTTTGAVTADYDFFPGNPAVGISRYFTSSGTTELLAWDTKRVNTYDEGDSKFEDVTGSDDWTGSQSNFIWVENWKDTLFCTNGIDRVKQYNGTAFSNLTIDTTGNASNNVATCLMMFAHKERLILLRTTEDGTAYNQRARWPVAGNFTNWVDGDSGGAGGYVDAPTSDAIVTAQFLGDDLIVYFERSTWKLRYTANASLPFRWERIDPETGSLSPKSSALVNKRIIAAGASNIIATDGLDVDEIDDKVPDLALDIDQANIELVNTVVDKSVRRAIVVYPSIDATACDEAVALNYKDWSWSIYDYPFSCFGDYIASGDYTLDDYDIDMDDMEISFDERTQQAGFPAILAGDSTGYVYQTNDGGDDNGSDINFYATTGRLNPYLKEGYGARLGYVDFLVGRDDSISFTVSFYSGNDPTAHTTQTITCDSTASVEDKVIKRAFCGSADDFHRMKITNNASNQTLKIYAMIYWFKRAGRIK